MTRFTLTVLSFVTAAAGFAQNNDKGTFSGNFMSNAQFYDRDKEIGATTEVYNKYKSSADAFLYMNYGFKDYSFSLRYDVFNNSPLLNPQSVYNKQGIGFWQASRDIKNLNITLWPITWTNVLK